MDSGQVFCALRSRLSSSFSCAGADTAPFRYPHFHSATDTPDKLDYDRFALVVSGTEKTIAEIAK